MGDLVPVLCQEVIPGDKLRINMEQLVRFMPLVAPITDGAPIIYTEKKDGVLPQYDIRTDKWEIAQSAMDLANASKIAKSKGLKKPDEPKQTEPKQTEPKQTEPTN